MRPASAPRSDERTLSALLQSAGVPHEFIDVGDYARTAQEAADRLGAPLSAIVKSLVCEADGSPIVALVPGDKALSFERLGAVAGACAVRLAGRRKVQEASGYAVGAVAPVGLPAHLSVYGHISILDAAAVYCGAGSDHHMFRIAPGDLQTLARVVWADICE